MPVVPIDATPGEHLVTRTSLQRTLCDERERIDLLCELVGPEVESPHNTWHKGLYGDPLGPQSTTVLRLAELGPKVHVPGVCLVGVQVAVLHHVRWVASLLRLSPCTVSSIAPHNRQSTQVAEVHKRGGLVRVVLGRAWTLPRCRLGTSPARPEPVPFPPMAARVQRDWAAEVKVERSPHRALLEPCLSLA